VIGKKGEEIEALRPSCAASWACGGAREHRGDRKPEIDAQLIADSIGSSSRSASWFRRAMKRAMQNAMRPGAQGIKIMSADA